MKKTRVLGFDDGPVSSEEKSTVIGVLCREDVIEKVISFQVEKDGCRGTEGVIEVLKKNGFKEHVKAVFVDGVAFAGFNIVDAEKVYEESGVPVITVMRKKPRYEKMYEAMKEAGKEEEIKTIKNFPEPRKVENIHVQAFGLEFEDAEKIVKNYIENSNIPEPLRIADLIAEGVS